LIGLSGSLPLLGLATLEQLAPVALGNLDAEPLDGGTMRFQARSRSVSLTPSTWPKRAMALRTWAASLSGSLRSSGAANWLSESRFSSAVLIPSLIFGTSLAVGPLVLYLTGPFEFRRAASFCFVVATGSAPLPSLSLLLPLGARAQPQPGPRAAICSIS
jgi:hypothetical protein